MPLPVAARQLTRLSRPRNAARPRSFATDGATAAADAAHEPPPFDFESIDRIVRARQPARPRAVDVDEEHRSIFFGLLREVNAAVYAANDALARNTRHLTLTATETQPGRKPEGEWLCERVEAHLQQFKIDNRIIVLQRALAAWHHTRQRHWRRLAKTALRSCLINDEVPGATQLVKVCAALSKWRFRAGLAEVGHRLDLAILAESRWEMHGASHVLWSLAHLRAFDMRAFDYMNNVVARALAGGVVDGVAPAGWDETLHRIVNANLIRMSHTGSHHAVMEAVVDALLAQPELFNQMSPKTLLAVGSLLPLHGETGALASHLVAKVAQGMHRFTHTQAAHMLYNFALVRPKLPADIVEQLAAALFEFKEMLYKADAAYVPSLTCKLMFTFRAFLSTDDHQFVSKCLADLNANLHLLVPFSLIGSLQCLGLYEESLTAAPASPPARSTEKQLASIANTRSNLVRYDLSGEFAKPSGAGSAEVEPVDNLKLWHRAALFRLTGQGYKAMMDALSGFVDRVDEGHPAPALKDFLLFLANVSHDRKLAGDRYVQNSVLIAAVQLRGLAGDGLRGSEYWDHILLHLEAMRLREVFERETAQTVSQRDLKARRGLVHALRLCLSAQKNEGNDGEIIACLRAAAAQGAVTTTTGLITRYILFNSCVSGGSIANVIGQDAARSLGQRLTEHFYDAVRGPVLDASNSADGENSTLMEYLQTSLQVRLEPPNLGMAYTRAFFLQDQPPLLMQALPEVIMGQLAPQQRYTVCSWDVARWMHAEKGNDALTRYLEHVKEAKPKSEHKLSEVAGNLDRAAFDVRRIRQNFHVGPFRCHLGIFGAAETQNTLVFINGQRGAPPPAEHVFDRERRLALTTLGFRFVELEIVDRTDNVAHP